MYYMIYWDRATDTWTPEELDITVHTGTPFQPLSCISYDSVNHHIYVAGNFTAINGVSAMNVAKWDGANWSPLDSGLGSHDTWITAIGYTGGWLYANYPSTPYLKLWNGSAWLDPLESLNNNVNRIVRNKFAPGVLIGGDFTKSGSYAYLAKAVERSIGSLAYNPGGAVLAIHCNTNTGYIYVGGLMAGLIQRYKYTPPAPWESVGGGLYGTAAPRVNSICTSDKGDVFAFGSFLRAGAPSPDGIPALRAAWWNGEEWKQMANGAGGTAGYWSIYEKDGVIVTT